MDIRRIGVIFDTVGVYGRSIFHGVTRYGRTVRNWRLRHPPLWVYWRSIGWEEWPVDAYIIQITDERMLATVTQRKLPTVNVSSSLPSYPLPSVMPDNVAVGRLAAEHLMSRAFDRFAYFGFAGTGFSRDRQNGFCQRLQEAGFPCDVYEDRSPENFAAQARWLAELPKPCGLLAYSDRAASELINLCAERDIGVPEQIAILGVDDDELFRDLTGVSLSSITLPLEEIGYRAAAWLDEMLDGRVPAKGRAAPRELLPPVGVALRQSTAIQAIHDPEVAAAVRFIGQHAHEQIDVKDVVRAVLISRRSLERRFRASLGRTPLEEIRRVRLERVRHLLIDSPLPMPQVARRSGFTDTTYMATAFREVFGQSPRAYRKQHGRRVTATSL